MLLLEPSQGRDMSPLSIQLLKAAAGSVMNSVVCRLGLAGRGSIGGLESKPLSEGVHEGVIIREDWGTGCREGCIGVTWKKRHGKFKRNNDCVSGLRAFIQPWASLALPGGDRAAGFCFRVGTWKGRDGLVLGEWGDGRLGISPGARGKLGEGGGGGAGQVSAEDPGLRIPVLEPSEAALLASERRVVGTNAWPSSLWGGEELCDCPSLWPVLLFLVANLCIEGVCNVWLLKTWVWIPTLPFVN